jgi:hypothetical protein
MIKTIRILAIVLIACSCTTTTSSININVAGKIYNNSEYNGGPPPPQEILDALAVYHLSANQLFYVRNTTNYAPYTQIITSFTTDAYAIISKDKYDFEQNSMATTDCIYLQQPDKILNVVSIPQIYNWSYTAKANVCVPHP